MTFKESFLTNNDCFKANKRLTIKGIMLHSVGVPQPSAKVFLDTWNVPKPGGRDVCVHAFVDACDCVFQTLPWTVRGWHAGTGMAGSAASANNTHIGVEMTEPASIRYTKGTLFTDLNPTETKRHVFATFHTACALFASLCLQFSLDPMADGVILSHSEGQRRGIASAHADPEHIWGKFDLTMSRFRREVNNTLHMIKAPSAWATEAWSWAMNNRVCNGMNPRDFTTREETAVMLHRVYKLLAAEKGTGSSSGATSGKNDSR